MSHSPTSIPIPFLILSSLSLSLSHLKWKETNVLTHFILNSMRFMCVNTNMHLKFTQKWMNYNEFERVLIEKKKLKRKEKRRNNLVSALFLILAKKKSSSRANNNIYLEREHVLIWIVVSFWIFNLYKNIIYIYIYIYINTNFNKWKNIAK